MFRHLVALVFFLHVETYETALIANFSQGPPIYGVASDNDNIYVIKESQTAMNIYKPSTFALKVNTSLPIIAGPYDMIYSKTVDNLFVLDWFHSVDVIRVHLDRRFDSSTWKFTPAYTSASLSITPEQNIIITMTKTGKFGEYDAAGRLLKLVALQNISDPRQVIKINGNKYAVCFGYDVNKTHGVCLVDGKGKTLNCLEGPPGSSLTQLNVPARMLLTGKGSILVADMKNARIVELWSDLSRMKIILSASDGLTQPYRMFLQQSKKRLLVANNQLDPKTGYAVSGHILVFDYKE